MKMYIVSILLSLGAAFMLLAAVGLVRFKDLYSRMHATTKATSFGTLLLLIGVSIFFNTAGIYIKSFLIIIFIYLTAPLAAHSIAKSFIDKNKKYTDEPSHNNKFDTHSHDYNVGANIVWRTICLSWRAPSDN